MKYLYIIVPVVAAGGLVTHMAISSRGTSQIAPVAAPVTTSVLPAAPVTTRRGTGAGRSGSSAIPTIAAAPAVSDKTPTLPPREVQGSELERYIQLLRERFAVETLGKIYAVEDALEKAEDLKTELDRQWEALEEEYNRKVEAARKQSEAMEGTVRIDEVEARWRFDSQTVSPDDLPRFKQLAAQLVEIEKAIVAKKDEPWQQRQELANQGSELRTEMNRLRGRNRVDDEYLERFPADRRAKIKQEYAQIQAERETLEKKVQSARRVMSALYPQMPASPTAKFAFPEFAFLDPGQNDHLVLDTGDGVELKLQVVTDPQKSYTLEQTPAELEVVYEGKTAVTWQQRPGESFKVAKAEQGGDKPIYDQGQLTVPRGVYHLRLTVQGAGGKPVVAVRPVVHVGDYELPVPTSVHGAQWPSLTKLKEQIAFAHQRRDNMRQLANKYWVWSQSGPKAADKGNNSASWIYSNEDAMNAWAENERVAQLRIDEARKLTDQYFTILAGQYHRISSQERMAVQADVLSRALLLRQARTESARRSWAMARGLPLLYPILPYERDNVDRWLKRMKARGEHYQTAFREKQWAEEELSLVQRSLKWVSTARALNIQTTRLSELEEQLAVEPEDKQAAILADLAAERRELVLARGDAAIGTVIANEVIREKQLEQLKLPYLGLQKQWDTLARVWRVEHGSFDSQKSNAYIALANAGFSLIDLCVALGLDTSQATFNQVFGTRFERTAQKIDGKIMTLHDRNSRAIQYLLDLHQMDAAALAAANQLAVQASRELTPEQIQELSDLIGEQYHMAMHNDLLRDQAFFRRTDGGLLRILGGICATGIEKRRQEYAIGLAGAKLTLFHEQKNFFASLGRDMTGSFAWSTWTSPAKFLSEGIGEYIDNVSQGGRIERRVDLENKAYQIRHFEELRKPFEYVGYDLAKLADPRLKANRQKHHELLASNADYREFYRRLRQLDYARVTWEAKRRLAQELAKEEPSDEVVGAEIFTIKSAPLRAASEDLAHRRSILWLRLRDALMGCDWQAAIDTTKRMEALGMGDMTPARRAINDLITRDLGCQVLQNWGDAAIYQACTAKIGSFFSSQGQLRTELQKRLVSRRGVVMRSLVGRTFTFGGLGSYWWSVANPLSQGVRAAVIDGIENIGQKYLADETIEAFKSAGYKLDPAVADKLSQLAFDLAGGIVSTVHERRKEATDRVPEDATEFKKYLTEHADELGDHPVLEAAERLASAAEALRAARGSDAETVRQAEVEFGLCMGDMRDLLAVADGGKKCALLETQILKHVLGGTAGDAPVKMLTEIDTINRSQFANLIADHQQTRHLDRVRAAVVDYYSAVGEGESDQAVRASVDLLAKMDMDRLCKLKDAGLLSYTDEKAIDRARRTVVHQVRQEIAQEFAGDLVAIVITGTGGDTANPEYKRLGSDQDFTYLTRDGVEANRLKKRFDERFVELTGRAPAEFAIECFQDPISKLSGISSESMSRTFSRLRAEGGQGERYLIFGNLKLFRFIDQRVGRGQKVVDGNLQSMPDAEFEALFGDNRFTQGDGFDIVVDNCAFISHYEHRYTGSPVELLAHIAKYDIRILAGVMAATPDGVVSLNGLTREKIGEAGFHDAVVREARQVPSLKATLADDPKVVAYYDTLAKLKQGMSVADALGIKRKPSQTTAEFSHEIESRAAELITLGNAVREQHIELTTKRRLEYRQKLAETVDKLDQIVMSATATEAEKKEASDALKQVGQELRNRDFAAGFQLRKLSGEQAGAIAGQGGDAIHGADTLLKLRDILVQMDQIPETAQFAVTASTCPVF